MTNGCELDERTLRAAGSGKSVLMYEKYWEAMESALLGKTEGLE